MRNRPNAIVTIGLPSSGKSTLAQAVMTDNTVIIERDIERESIGGGSRQEFYRLSRESDGVYENAVTQECYLQMRKAAKSKKDIIVADTNTNRFNRYQLYRTLFDLGFTIQPVLMQVSTEICLERNREREPDHQVPDHVIRRMSDALEKDRELIMAENTVLNTIYDTPARSGDIVFDIDGTLAQMHNRGPFEWHKVINDQPRKNVVHLCKCYIDDGRNVVFFSGRDGVSFNDTLEWLRKWISIKLDESHLYMRKAGDSRVDWVVKGEIMIDYVNERGLPPSLCIDDRQQVIDIWRNMSIEAWQVDAGKF